jgi:predicted AAA+ superfamily ATPase
MEMKEYYPRICDRVLQYKLKISGAVLIVGAKWCGKTETALQSANSVLFIQESPQHKETAKIAPSLLLEGETPRLIDEWQDAPEVWDAVRHTVDRRNKPGQFILTGSATPRDQVKAHTGIGRISRILMRPMSLFESKDSEGIVSLNELFKGNHSIAAVSKLEIPQIARLICRGGWPGAVTFPEMEGALAREYADMIVEEDIIRVDGVERNSHRVRLVLHSLARNISTLTTAKTILEDVRANDVTINERTLDNYLNALRRLFVVEDVPAWSPSLRSKTTIRTSDKRQLVDPSIAAAILRIEADRLLLDPKSFGFLFESLCTRDMRIYAQVNDGEIFHYRDKDNLEVDMIVSLHDGRWAPVEVKLGEHRIDEAAESLLRLRNKVDTSRIGEPSFMMVLTGGRYAYKRPDGVLVVPLGCLKD